MRAIKNILLRLYSTTDARAVHGIINKLKFLQSRCWIPAVFTKPCYICGKQFQSSAHNAKHCSRECKLEAKRRRRISSLGPSKTFNKECERCGETFETRTTNKKYCSRECYRLATAERKRAERSTRHQKTPKSKSEKAFLSLCSVCWSEMVPVSECLECGYLNCDKCSDARASELCGVCSGEQTVPAL